MKPDSSARRDLLGITTAITPTTLNALTSFLESDECLYSLKTYAETGAIVEQQQPKQQQLAPSATIPASVAWHGGTTIVVTSDHNAWSPATPTTPTSPPTATRRSTRIAASKSMPKRPMTPDSPEPASPVVARRSSATSGSRPGPRPGPRSGRRSYRSVCEDNLPEEERERIRIRRLRNKEAAARCRKRRVDQTSELQDEVDEWESKKKQLEQEIAALTDKKNELEYILAAHHCNVSVEPQQNHVVMVAQQEHVVLVEAEEADNTHLRRRRPLSLTIPTTVAVLTSSAEDSGVGIELETPSAYAAVSAALGFDSVSGGTGLTPVVTCTSATPFFATTTTTTTSSSSNCSSQMRSSASNDVSTPEYFVL